MKETFVRPAVGLLLFSMTLVGTVQAESVVVAYRMLPAFHENAPRSIATSMRKAVERTCDNRSKNSVAKDNSVAQDAQNRGLCDDGRLRFFRPLDVRGKRQPRAILPGFVCTSDAGIEDLKYYTDNMFAENPRCALVWYNSKTKAYSLDRNERG